MHYDRKFINGAEGRSEDWTYKINGHKVELYIYEKDNKINTEIYSRHITHEVYDILNIPVIDN